MRAYIDLDTLQLQRRLSGYPVLEIEAKRGSIVPLEIQFVRDCVVVDLDQVSSFQLSTETGEIITDESGQRLLVEEPGGVFGMKAVGNFQAPAYVVSAAWQKTGSGTSAVYTFNPTYLTVALDALLANNESVTLSGEIQWAVATDVYKTLNVFETVVRNSVVRGTETPSNYPANAEVVALADITSLTGGEAPTDLDAIPLAAYALGTLFDVVTGSGSSRGASRWEKIAGTQTTTADTGGSYIRTLDYDSSDPHVLYRVSGG